VRVLVCDPTDASAVDAMRQAGIDVDVRDDIGASRLAEVIGDYEGLVVRSRTKVPASLIDRATKLRAIVRGGVGLDNIDVDHARERGIEVMNTPAASSVSVAELTIGYLFALARQIPQATASMRAGRWDKKAFSKGTELAGKTLGVIGCGRIGQEVVRRGVALGMHTIFDSYPAPDIPGAHHVVLDTLLHSSDFITLHVPLVRGTYHIIGKPQLEVMKQGVYIINCSRGGTVDEEALYEAIVAAKVAGAALDVFEDEKEDRGQKLFTLPQVIGSPHVGAGTREATERVGAEVAERMIDFYRSGRGG